MRSVPFFNYPHVFKNSEDRFIETLRDVGRRGAFIMQKDLADFERNLAAYTGAKYAVGVSNATDGLQIAFMAGGLKAGEEVILCSHTMVATAAAVHFAGGIPVPVEAGPDHLIDPAAIEAAITPRTRAICPTQLNGRTCNMDAIEAIARKHGLEIYEDAAQALGSKFKGKGAGTFGRAACISFYPAKVLGCLGDGGAVLTNDDEIYRQLLLLRDHGRDHTGEVVMWGTNARLDNVEAAYLDFQLKDYPGVVIRRRAIASLYQSLLGDVPEVRLPAAPGSEPDHFDIFQNYEIEAQNRDALKDHLKSRNVGTLIQWGGRAVHQFPKLGFTQRLPKTDALFQRLLMLPLNMSMVDDDVRYVAECIREFYKR
ncbi:DegT/DnrJ/EryC1/StrS family aminotransferase [Oleiharenicola sp. Vm1]|uniref:DegT/DnrJ/EryC1/StrS family aminotransferase n=1 Tax=Oleiharenicola sp. Vm1 TaxID=3398393 RepID=UPI0039F4DE10